MKNITRSNVLKNFELNEICCSELLDMMFIRIVCVMEVGMKVSEQHLENF